MSRAAPFLTVPFLLAVVITAVFLFTPGLYTAVSAAPFPSDTTASTTDSGWVINEIHADPASDLSGDANGDGLRDAGHDEFIELYNDTGATADISGWTVADEFEVKHTFPQETVVPDGCAVVVFGGGLPTGTFGHAVVQTAASGGLGLDNTGDTITLSDSLNIIQSAAYGFEGNEDQSLTRDPDVSGPFVGHLTAGSTRFSPGTRVDGSYFEGCDMPPVLLEMQPADGAAEVAIGSAIALTFSEPVTFTEPWYEISCTQSESHTAVTNGSETSITLVPDLPFAYEEICQITLFGAAIWDRDGNPQSMEADVQWQFTTEREADDAPQVVDSFPTDGALGITLAATFSITFSEPVNLAETAVALNCSHSGDLSPALSGGPLQFQLHPPTEMQQGELCTLTAAAEDVTDLDENDPPDRMADNWQISFSTEAADFLLINELDSETPGIDDAEFIELFDGGRGRTRLDGLSIILFSGHNDSAYAGYDLAGWQTDDNGYFLLGSSGVAGVDLILDDTRLQNGADAVALYQARAAQMPLGTVVTTENLLDALVYGTGQEQDAGLLPLLYPGEIQVNEDGLSLDDFHSLQRCPGGSGGQRRTGTYWPDWPTPKTANTCVKDSAPQITFAAPADGSSGVHLDSDLQVTFNEPVTVHDQWFAISCQNSGIHDAVVSGEGLQYSLLPTTPFAYAEQCQATIFADKVHDLDVADPPDHLEADYLWSFTTAPARHILINELDADTPGADTAEFIELTDGGLGSTALDGLVLVLFNGADDLSYRAIALNEQQTDEQGRFVIGSTAVPGVDLVLPDGVIQNGADAVALYEGSIEAFPNGSPITTLNLLDAVVYGTADEPDDELLALLAESEQQLDEDGRGNAAGDSNQRCPDGAGGQRRSSSFLPNLATPDEANRCSYDEAPALLSTTPAAGAKDVTTSLSITLNFSEAVDVEENWFTFVCEKSGSPAVRVRHSNNELILKPRADLLHNDACTVTVLGARVHDSDLDDPPDNMVGDFSWSFETVALPAARHVVINEVDADTPGQDTAEFIELYDGGQGSTALDGLVVVLFNGHDDLSYKSLDLDGYHTDGRGYFVIGNTAVPGGEHLLSNGLLQNGPDAVALYVGDADDFVRGTAVSTTDLLDALVYSTGDDEEAPGLLRLLHSGESIVDEAGRGARENHSSQRCPNGAGTQRRTGAFLQNTPTPKAANFCEIDSPPRVTRHDPVDGAGAVAGDAAISIIFSEPVTLDSNGVHLQCSRSGMYELAISGGPASFTLKPHSPIAPGDACTVTLFGNKVSDLDNNDPPDGMDGDYAWSFTTASVPLARHVLINEVDADTPGADKVEFIELYDGGAGSTALDGLELILFNGATDRVYRRIDLAGHLTGAGGYFVIGGSAVSGVDLVIANGTIQNGPDAVALYVRDETNGEPDEKGLLDALVYHTNDEEDAGLAFLLLKDEPQVNEGHWHDPALDSNQRCPNGQGRQRVTSGYIQNPPTPGLANNCTVDNPPAVVQVFPTAGAQDVPPDSSLAVHFDEPVQLDEGWIALSCAQVGVVDLAITGGPAQYTMQPAALAPFDSCTAMIVGDLVHDLDGQADALGGDYGWQFTTGKPPESVSAAFTTSSPVTIGAHVRFINASHGSQPLTFAWDFGDGTPLVNEANPLHLYTAVGTYTVTLTVKTGWGETAVTSAVVEILPVRIYVPMSTS